MVEVVAALIEKDEKIMICQRPRNKKRALCWEFVGGKVEAGESKRDALIRECREELAIEVLPLDEYCTVEYSYPDIDIRLTVFRTEIVGGTPRALEHEDIRWICRGEMSQYSFCPADRDIVAKLMSE